MGNKIVYHVCELPIWEHHYYWETLSYVYEQGMIDLENIPPELEKYETKNIKEVLKYAEKEDKQVKRTSKTKWKWNK